MRKAFPIACCSMWARYRLNFLENNLRPCIEIDVA